MSGGMGMNAGAGGVGGGMGMGGGAGAGNMGMGMGGGMNAGGMGGAASPFDPAAMSKFFASMGWVRCRLFSCEHKFSLTAPHASPIPFGPLPSPSPSPNLASDDIRARGTRS